MNPTCGFGLVKKKKQNNNNAEDGGYRETERKVKEINLNARDFGRPKKKKEKTESWLLPKASRV